MGRTLARLALLVLAFALGTYALGWWAVPAIALVWGLMSAGAPRTALRAGVGALVAWALLLLVPALFGAPVFSFGAKLAAAMAVPLSALYVAELVFPLVAAWSAAAIGSAMRGGGAAAAGEPAPQ